MVQNNRAVFHSLLVKVRDLGGAFDLNQAMDQALHGAQSRPSLW